MDKLIHEIYGFCLYHLHTSKYLRITINRIISYKQHLKNIAARISTRNNILAKLCGTTWSATANTLHTSGVGLVYSIVEYRAPVWLNICHTDNVDVKLKRNLRIITICFKTTPTSHRHTYADMSIYKNKWKTLTTYLCRFPPFLRLKFRKSAVKTPERVAEGKFNIL